MTYLIGSCQLEKFVLPSSLKYEMILSTNMIIMFIYYMKILNSSQKISEYAITSEPSITRT